MTVMEVAKVLGVSREAIKKHIRELFPDLMRNGVATYLNEEQVSLIKQRISSTTNTESRAKKKFQVEKEHLEGQYFEVPVVKQMIFQFNKPVKLEF